MNKEYILLEETKAGLFPVGSVVEVNGEKAFWRDIDASKFLFKKGDYTAIFQDEVVIDYLSTTPVKNLYFRDYRRGKVYKTSLEAYKEAKSVSMRGRKQRGLNLIRFNVLDNAGMPTITRPDAKVVINA